MVFVIDEQFAKMWEKHCDVLTGVLADCFVRFEKLIREEIEFSGFDILSSCNCLDLSDYFGKCSAEFSNLEHVVSFDFRGHGKKETALRINVRFNYEDNEIPFCRRVMESNLGFINKEKIRLMCSEYNYFLYVTEICTLSFDFEIVDFALQNLLIYDVLVYMMKKVLGKLPFEKSVFSIELDDWKEYVL